MNYQDTRNVCARPRRQQREVRRQRRQVGLTLSELPVVRKRRSGAFTLIELLVVIAIIAMLVSIMVPSFHRVRELARRSMCAVNLRSISIGLVIYGETFKSYPSVDGDDDVGIAADAPDVTVTGHLYALVRENICQPGIFICPSTRNEADSRDLDRWDFSDPSCVSYGLMNPYGPGRYFGEGESSKIILGDIGPYYDLNTRQRNNLAVVDFDDASRDEIEAGNSPNHKGDGQNVANASGAAWFEFRADCGPGGDNIYTRADTEDGTDPHGEVPDGQIGGDDIGPAGPQDIWLVP